MLLQILVAVLCVIAGIACLAPAFDSGPQKPILVIARRITGVTMVSAGVNIVYMLYDYGHVNPFMCYSLGVLAVGQILFAMNAVLDDTLVAKLTHTTGESRNANHA